MNWDVFVSHAFEDKELARALAEGLHKKGLHVWFDGFELRVGDSLRRSIDYGLANSRFGVVVLSPSFFAKEWTQKELGALTARETKNRKIILPIWHNISVREIKRHSPILADRYAINTVVGIDKTVEYLCSEIENYKVKQSQPVNVPVVSIKDLDTIVTELEKIKRSLAVKETELKTVLARADEVSHTDELTLLPNRRAILRDLKREMVFSGRYGTPLSIAIVDIDHFKQVNDRHGHIVGDEVLRDFASILRKPILHPDTIGRYGGAEFLIVMPHTPLRQAGIVCDRLYGWIQDNPIVNREMTFRFTVSIGLAQYRGKDEDLYQFLNRADEDLYRAKGNRRN